MHLGGAHFDPDTTSGEVKALLSLAKVQSYPRRSIVSAAGQVTQPWLQVLKGILGLRVAARPEEPAVWTDFLTPGQSWAPSHTEVLELSLVELVALSPSQVVTLPQPAYRELCRHSTVWLYAELQSAQRSLLRHHVRRAADALPLEGKLAYFWWALSSPYSDGQRIFIGHIPQHVLASFLRVSREEVSRKTQMLEKAGYLKVENQRVILYPDVAFMFSFQEQWSPVFGGTLQT